MEKQIQGKYEVKDPILGKYYSMVVKLLRSFPKVEVDKVP